MPKKGHKSRHHHKIGDVTIKEFADSQTCTNRLKKGNLTDRENMFDLEANTFTECEDSALVKSSKSSKANQNDSLDQQIFFNYPIDIWLLISQHIRPEDICRFSLICRATAQICAMPVFWFSLYKRYYSNANEDIIRTIPVRLQPDCMVRYQKLRACVIRSLFYTYKPFVDRLPALAKQDFHNLKSYRIVINWAGSDDKDMWVFYYKLRNKAVNGRCLKASDCRLASKQNDILCNPEQGCKILVITTKRFSPLPDFRGTTTTVLNSINHSLTNNLRDYKLTLTFCNYQKQMVHSTVQTVVYDPVSRVEVLDWWTPGYTKFFE